MSATRDQGSRHTYHYFSRSTHQQRTVVYLSSNPVKVQQLPYSADPQGTSCEDGGAELPVGSS